MGATAARGAGELRKTRPEVPGAAGIGLKKYLHGTYKKVGVLLWVSLGRNRLV